MKYLETIYKPLKRNGQVDNEILEKWFKSKKNLDMTMGLTDKSAQYVINNLSESQLMSIIRILGEEKDAKKIAKNIAKARVEKEITRVDELVNIIEKSKRKNFSTRNL